jgi:NAD(P)-dependent dehydrogenase (short-subunit alcohol dehydrogenase family)
MQTAIVTGAGSKRGIGRATAHALAATGWHVAVLDLDEAGAKDVADEIAEQHGVQTVGVACDVTDEASVEAFFAAAGPVDVLVNNAGAASMAPLEDFDDAAWDDVLAVNLKGVAHLTRFMLPGLRSRSAPDDPARVVNIGSISGERVGNLDNFAYTSSKAGLHHLTRHLARRLAPSVTVNAIAPGPFASRLTAGVIDAVAPAVPLQRVGCPDDIASAAIYLASPAASWVTGTILTVDGGLSLT